MPAARSKCSAGHPSTTAILNSAAKRLAVLAAKLHANSVHEHCRRRSGGEECHAPDTDQFGSMAVAMDGEQPRDYSSQCGTPESWFALSLCSDTDDDHAYWSELSSSSPSAASTATAATSTSRKSTTSYNRRKYRLSPYAAKSRRHTQAHHNSPIPESPPADSPRVPTYTATSVPLASPPPTSTSTFVNSGAKMHMCTRCPAGSVCLHLVLEKLKQSGAVPEEWDEQWMASEDVVLLRDSVRSMALL